MYKRQGIKTTTATVLNYVDYFKEAFILLNARRYDIKGKALLSSTEKYYAVAVSYTHLLQALQQGLHIVDYNLHTTRYLLKETRIPAFQGNVDVYKRQEYNPRKGAKAYGMDVVSHFMAVQSPQGGESLVVSLPCEIWSVQSP